MNWYLDQTIDLSEPEKGRHITLNPLVVVGDSNAHTWRVTVFNNGEAYSLSGMTVEGSFIRPGGATVVQTGSVSDNVASVTFPDQACIYAGTLKCILRVYDSGSVMAAAAMWCTVQLGETYQIVDPQGIVPSVSNILAEYAAMETAVSNTEAATDTALAAAATAAEQVTKQPEAMMTAGWDDVRARTLEAGGVKTDDGSSTTSNLYARTGWVYFNRPLLFHFTAGDTYKYNIWTYSSNTASSKYKSCTGGAYVVAQDTLIPNDGGSAKYFRIAFRAVEDSVTLTQDDYNAILAAMSFMTLGDTTMSTLGAAADASFTGRNLDMIKRSGGEVTRNLWLDGDVEITGSSGFVTMMLLKPIPAGTYTVSALIEKTGSTSAAFFAFSSSRGTAWGTESYVGSGQIAYGSRSSATVTLTDTAYSVRLFLSTNSSSSAGLTGAWRDIQIESGSTATDYVRPYLSIDYEARAMAATLEPTGDQTDRAAEIVALLTKYGECRLGKGDYYISPLTMPDSTTLSGRGDATKLRLIEGPGGAAVRMKDRCTVKDISFIGASSDITLTGDVEGTGIVDTGAANQWDDGDISIDGTGNDGFRHMVMTNPLPAGTYRISARVSSTDTDRTTSLFALSASQSTAISSLLVSLQLERRGPDDDPYVTTFTLTETAYSVRLAASDNTTRSAGDTATFSDITITRIGDRYGVAWYGEYHMSGNTRVYDYKPYYGVLTGCRFSRFSGAGVLMRDTSASVNNGLMITNCGATNCNIGLYIRDRSEFVKIANCTIDHNYFGLLGRGGNMAMSNCGIDMNKIGIQIDQDEGSNGGHGSITGCTINHNGPVVTTPQGKGYGLIVKSTGGMFVSNCQFYYDKVWLLDTGRNTITGCMFSGDYSAGEDYSGVDIEDGSASFVFGCIFRNSNHKVKLINNSASKVANCYYNNGTEVTPTVVTG